MLVLMCYRDKARYPRSNKPEICLKIESQMMPLANQMFRVDLLLPGRVLVYCTVLFSTVHYIQIDSGDGEKKKP